MKKSILFIQVFLLVITPAIASTAGISPVGLLRAAIKEGRTIKEKSDVNITAKLLSGLILTGDSIDTPIMMTNISKFVVNKGATTFGAGGCFIVAKYSGLKKGVPTMDVLRISCIDSAHNAYEFANETSPYLGTVTGSRQGNNIKLGADEIGNKAINAGIDVRIRLHQQLISPSKIPLNIKDNTIVPSLGQ